MHLAKFLTPEEGEAKWTDMVKEIASLNPEYFSIKIDDALHIRIATKLRMDFVTSVARQNRIDLTISADRKSTQETIDAAARRSSLHMDRLGGSELDLAQMGGAILANSGSSPLEALSGIAQTLPNIKALLPVESINKDDDDDDDDDEGQGEGEASATKPNHKKINH